MGFIQHRYRRFTLTVVVEELGVSVQQRRIVRVDPPQRLELWRDKRRLADAAQDAHQITERVGGIAAITGGSVQQAGGMLTMATGTGRESAQQQRLGIVGIVRQ